MIHYGVVWHPTTDNLGDDLLALAAMRLLPKVDCVLDGDRLDAPIAGMTAEDRVITLLAGNVFRQIHHWPPERHIVPVCVGMHFSQESVWGVPLSELDGEGLAWLKQLAPIGCRDDATFARLQQLRLPVEMTACLTLTLSSNADKPEEPYICCVDVPDEVESVLRQTAKDIDVRTMTHQRRGYDVDFDRRMQHAQWMVDTYAGAQLLITRRLHAAMAGVALGVPTLLLYNSDYEDVTRFAPMDQMIRHMPVDAFVDMVRSGGFSSAWENPACVKVWREKVLAFVQAGLERAMTGEMSCITEEAAEAWRKRCLLRLADKSERKIRRLEREQLATLHEKFSQLMREDQAKMVLLEVLDEKSVQQALARVARNRLLRKLPWYKRPLAWLDMVSHPELTESLAQNLRETLAGIGWPESGSMPAAGECDKT